MWLIPHGCRAGGLRSIGKLTRGAAAALAPAGEIVQRARRSGLPRTSPIQKAESALSNSNTLPWVIAVVATAIGAGAIGFFARPMIVSDAPVARPVQPQNPRDALPPGTTTERIEDWTLICTPSNEPERPICFAAQDIRTPPRDQNTPGQLLMALLAGYEGGGQRAFLVRAPLGVQLDQGLIFQMGDEQPAAFAFNACSDVSCDAQLVVPDGNFEKLEAAGSFTLGFVMADGTPVSGTVSMNGLGKAYERIIKPDVPAPTPAPAATPGAETPESAPVTGGGGDAPTPTPKPETP